jgi:tetratricopeptide (TPR) repeat protein
VYSSFDKLRTTLSSVEGSVRSVVYTRSIVGLLCCVLLSSAALTAQSQAPAKGGQTGRDLVLEPDPKPDLKAEPAGAGKRPIPAGVPRGYALVVGVSQYKNLDQSKQLQFPESDAESIFRVLINREGGSFPAENVHLLKGSQATLVNIRRELEEWLPSVATPADRVVVFFAGHGLVKDGRGYLAPWDVDPNHLDTTAYPMTTLGDVLAKKVKAGWKVLLTDACHSGKINAETTNETLDQQFSNLPTNFLTLTATTEREQSYEDPKLSTGFGFFTYFLIQAWKGNADNDPCDGRVTADELIEYVRTNVRRYAKDRNLTQTPTARGDYEPGMMLGVGKGCLTAGSKDQPSMLGTAIVETTGDDVDLYIDGDLVGKLSKDKPLTVPRLSSGLHEFKGVKAGYEPDRKEIMIAPDQTSTVTLRIRYVKQVKKAALDLNAGGEKLLLSQRSSISAMNMMPMARKQSEGDLKKAKDLFTRALAEEPNYTLAAFNLGQVNQLLGDEETSIAAYKHAMASDATHVESRIQCAAVLIEHGDPDEAIRHLTEVQRLEPKNDEVYAMLARAYWDKGVWAKSIELADQAIMLKESNAQAHLWRADSTRQLAAIEKDKTRQRSLYSQAREDYREFLKLTNYSTTTAEWLAFHFVGFHLGSRKHADRQPAYDALRTSGFLGLCLSEHKVGNPLRAREYCQRALDYSPKDPIAYFLLGNVNRDLYNEFQSCGYIKAAAGDYTKMISLNPDLDESKNAKNYLEQITGLWPKLGCKG